jgi:hypothetical protein
MHDQRIECMIRGSADKSLDEIIGHGSPDIAQVAHPRIPYKKGPIVSGLEIIHTSQIFCISEIPLHILISFSNTIVKAGHQT